MIILRNIVLTILLIWVSCTDIKRREIDHLPIIIGFVFILIFSILGLNNVSLKSSIIGFLIGGVLFTILSFWGMGGGDIKLMALVGFFLGWKYTLLVLQFSFLLGAITGILYVVIKKKGLKDFIPFGPSIAAATLIVVYFGSKIVNNLEIFWFLR